MATALPTATMDQPALQRDVTSDSPTNSGSDAPSSPLNAKTVASSVSDFDDGQFGAENPLDPGSELDGDPDDDPIAVCGYALKFPDDATSPEGLWKMMLERRCASRDFPPSRANIEGFHRKNSRLNTIPVRGAHFIEEDLSLFDADFFGISPSEAASLDPLQRWLLETAYLALENAGMPMENVSGSKMGVYTGAFGMDYLIQLCRDPENPPSYAALGIGISMLANRLSWFFNMHGPSIGMDSACSSTAMALDIACQSLKQGACETAMLAGCNLTTAPETYAWMANIGFLSPDSKCYSFDHRGNGYARGEGFGVMILKRLSHAIRDGNTIRAVIRATASNEDGKTPGITQPSREAQEALIRATYQKAGLSMAHTRFFEAHGTGTAIGDPREAQAIGCAFRKYRSGREPLYVGALKSNIGHLEGASGVAGVIKAILALEKGVIPPNTNFEKINPRIDTHFLAIKAYPWPTSGLRRASVNSFGYGGANSHIVLDDAYNYMRLRSLNGKHTTATAPPDLTLPSPGLPLHAVGPVLPKLIVLSSADKGGPKRIAQSLQNWAGSVGKYDGDLLGDLAYTLDSHRSSLGWRSFVVPDSPEGLRHIEEQISVPARVRSEPARIGFVFSGQGAQWFAMGRELMRYTSFKRELEQAGEYLESLGCSWSVVDELSKEEGDSNVDKAEFSQALCTVLQVALVNLLRTFGVVPAATVGHSSGEIAAAYAAGALSRESAWKVAYFRGVCSAELAEASAAAEASASTAEPKGNMMSIGVSEEEAREIIAPIDKTATSFGLSVACVNSPKNVTISGEDGLLTLVKRQMDKKRIFARKLKVPLAYHSRQMQAISAKYTDMMGTLSAPGPDESKAVAPMISSVLGERAPAERLIEPSYWAQNMVSPVRFSQAVSLMVAQSSAGLTKKIDRSHAHVSVVDHLLELGPHAALQGPIRDILNAAPRGKDIGYSPALRRGQSAMDTLLRLMGQLFCMGLPFDVRAVNEPGGKDLSQVSRNLITNLPGYPFDHTQRYWHESRKSRNYRFRENAPAELLGVASKDWDATEARWQLYLRTSEIPWAEDHVINGTVLYPAAGMMVMAVEAAKQLAEKNGKISGYTLRDVHFESAMDLSANASGLEVQTTLRSIGDSSSGQSGQGGPAFEFVIRSFLDKDKPRINARGTISVEMDPSELSASEWEKTKTLQQRQGLTRDLTNVISGCDTPIDSQEMYKFLDGSGISYGEAFQVSRGHRYNTQPRQAACDIDLFSSSKEPHVIHPATFDAILHLCFTALTSGGRRPMATSIPTRVGCIWISHDGLHSLPDQGPENITGCVTLTRSTKRASYYSGGAVAKGDSGEALVWYDDIELTNVTSVPAGPEADATSDLSAPTLPDPHQFCMDISNKVAIGKLDSQEIQALLDKMHPDVPDVSGFHRDLHHLCLVALEKLVAQVDPDTLNDTEGQWKRRYWNWAQHHLTRNREEMAADWDSPDSAIGKARGSFEQDIERLSSESNIGRAYATVASNLEGLIKGDVAPLELLMHSGLLDKFYDDATYYRGNGYAASYIDLLAHQNPGMKILEIGGGTASSTRAIINGLSSGSPDSGGALRISRFDFTDISPAFLGHARDLFSRFQSQMTFGTLDIERAPGEQGYGEGSYDLVLADNVLHATLDLRNTLRNVRKTLKPGGKLIMHEWVRADGWTGGFVFGLFPGWWFGADTGREMSPNVSVEQWDTLLKETGFTGTDIVIDDYIDNGPCSMCYLVATAGDDEVAAAAAAPVEQPAPPPSRNVTIVVDSASSLQRQLADALVQPMQDLLESGVRPQIQSFEEAAAVAKNGHSHGQDDILVFAMDYGPSFINNIDETGWANFQSLVESSRRVLWVSAGGGHEAAPEHGMLDGLARTLRFEQYGLQVVNVALDLGNPSTSPDFGKAVRHLTQIAQDMVSVSPYDSYEQEYQEIDGLLHTKRLVQANKVKTEIDEIVLGSRVESISLGQGSQTQFSMTTAPAPGQEEGPYYVETPALTEEGLTADDVDIEVKAVSLQPHERAAALGQSETQTFGDFCSGIVVRAGPNAGFKTGDHVFAAQPGAFRSHARVPSKAVVALPDGVSFSDACATVPSVAAAHSALDGIARVRPGDSVLVHDGAGPIGQAAIHYLASQDVKDVWTTVTGEEEFKTITEQLGLNPDHVLPKSWFDSASPSVSVSQWKSKFDIVLAPYADTKSSSLSMNCVRSGGRYILLRASSPSATAVNPQVVQQLQNPPASVSLSIIQLGSETPSARSLAYAAGALNEPQLISRARQHITQFSVPQLTGAFNRLKQVGDRESLVVNLDSTDDIEVRVSSQPRWSLRPDATYLIAGGLGGLGRQMARWLVRRGARYLILLSRSGQHKPEARELIDELEAQGVKVETPACDITDRERLRSILDECADKDKSNMPPVAGCIQSSMVITERIFQNMSYRDWRTTVDPKIKGSWNLHTELPRDMDFFVLASSVMGILGSGSLAAYNAANTFEDALAHYRRAAGLHAVSLNLGGIPDAGYLADSIRTAGSAGRIAGFESRKFVYTFVRDVCALLDLACDPSSGSAFRVKTNNNGHSVRLPRCQVTAGIRPPAHWKHLEEAHPTLNQPFWGHMHHLPASGLDEGDGEGDGAGKAQKKSVDVAEKLAGTSSLAEAAEVVSEALASRVASLLGTAEENVELQNPMHSYGLDSLSAIHIRNWLGKVFDVDVPVFEILGGASFNDAGMSVARKVHSRK